MPVCHACQRSIPGGIHHCILCGAPQTAFSAVEQAGYRSQRQPQRRSYALSGILLVGLLLLVAGFPGSLSLGGLIGIAFKAVCLGGPLGWLIGKAGGGVVAGVMLGAVFGIIFAVVGVAGALIGSGSVLVAALWGLAQGVVPGVIIGRQAEGER